MSARARCLAIVIALVLVLSAGCTVQQPDAATWREHARQALDDVASQVATTRTTLIQLGEDHLPSAYAVTLVADAEEAAAKAEESLSSLQPPRTLRARPDRVLALVGRAVDAVRTAREAVVAQRYDVPGLIAHLHRLKTALDARRAAL